MIWRLSACVLVAALLAGPWPPVATQAGSPAALSSTDADILHVLSRVTYGPRPGDVARVRALGLSTWLERQLDPARIDDGALEARLKTLPTLTMSIALLQREYPRVDPKASEAMQSGEMTRREMLARFPLGKRPFRIGAELAAARMVRAVASERQLQEVMVDFWFNHFNVFAAKGQLPWYVISYEQEVIRPHALGRFGDLVRGTARHPAMLFYLDNWLSARSDFVVPVGPNQGRKAGLNENYARELMELHTLGVDGGYTQRDVTEVARAFTGWTIDRLRADSRFIFRPTMHDRGEKTILGRHLPAGGGIEDGERVLDLLVRHPSTARFVATKLCRRFVADEPPPELVERVARAYQATDGDIRAMLRTIFASPEFRAPDARRAKIKTPLEFVGGAARAVGAVVDARGGFSLARASAEIGQPLYMAVPPTGHPDRAEAWVNAGALLGRMNFALALTQGRLPGVGVDLTPLVADAPRSEPTAVLDRLLATLLHGQATPETRAVLRMQLTSAEIIRQTPDDRGPANTDVEKLAALVIGSPEFQRR